MKTTLLISALLIGWSVPFGAVAADKTQTGKEAKPAAVQEKQKQPAVQPAKPAPKVELTGSYIKQDIRRNGIVTDGKNPVFVLDNDWIHQSGAADLSQLLIRSGFRH